MANDIPLVVTLWEHPNYTGRKRVLVKDTDTLDVQTFNDLTTSIEIHPGPGYQAWKTAHNGKEPTVGFYQNIAFEGAELILTTGRYADIKYLFNFGDAISSVRFNPTPAAAAAIKPIPLVVTIFKDSNFNGKRLQIVQDSRNLISDFGSEYNDNITSVRVEAGPDFVAGSKAQLFRDINFGGGGIDLPPGNFPDIGQSHGFNEVLSSIKVR